MLLEILDNVVGHVESAQFQSGWKLHSWNMGENGMAAIASASVSHDQVLVSYTDFLTPLSYLWVNLETGSTPAVLKKGPERFSSDSMVSEQWWAKSKDGVLVPYFIVHRKDWQLNGDNPTLLYGYGGFELPVTPKYLDAVGKIWLERGGVYVSANIRGGGEFGPAWHRAAMRENRQRAYDDFIAIAEDLIQRKVTAPNRLGIRGGSNGGLLTGAVTMQRPELFQAVVCEVPLLDMLRYARLLAGASWMEEYGNPEDPTMWEIIGKYSPYQNIHADRKYPEILFISSTKDDRVHPGHARKMAAKLLSLGKPVLYYENTEGGHGRSANIEQAIQLMTLEYSYLWEKLGK